MERISNTHGEVALDLTKLEAELNETTQTARKSQAHDTIRTRVGAIGPTISNAGGSNSRSITPRQTHVAEVVPENDIVNHPKHYTTHPSGIECITITEWMSFNLGNAVKYIWRANDKGTTIQDLQKARWHIDRELVRLEKLRDQT